MTTMAQPQRKEPKPQGLVSRMVLIVEDEQDLAEIIAFNLQREGYGVRHVTSGDVALVAIRRDRPDLILLDRMLPGLSGDEVASEVRRDPMLASTPILMLTAKAEESDVLVGFALGADDYVSKPFSMKVLIARIQAMLRRGEAPAIEIDGILRDGPIVVDRGRHEVRAGGQLIALTATEFRLLTTLIAASGRVLNRGNLIDRVLGQGAVVLDRTIDVHITSLRKKLGAADPVAARWIQTVRGVGYSFRSPSMD